MKCFATKGGHLHFHIALCTLPHRISSMGLICKLRGISLFRVDGKRCCFGMSTKCITGRVRMTRRHLRQTSTERGSPSARSRKPGCMNRIKSTRRPSGSGRCKRCENRQLVPLHNQISCLFHTWLHVPAWQASPARLEGC